MSRARCTSAAAIWAARRGTKLPSVSMYIDITDAEALVRDGNFLLVAEHELGHVLGAGTIWGGGSGKPDLRVDVGGSNPRFVGRQAVYEYNVLRNWRGATGYRGPRCETDVDECATGRHQCSSTQRCVNTQGGYRCE